MEKTTAERPASDRAALAASAVWLTMVLSGMFAVLCYSNAAGLAGNAPSQWPTSSTVPRASDLPTLVMFLHPQCPCSSASIGELEKLMAHCQGQVSAQMLFVKPSEMNEDWVQTGLWHTAATIPGVNVRCDHDGIESRRFQALTSGQVVLYDSSGSLLFQGGITVSRGHAGDNAGSAAVEALLRHEPLDFDQTPVFGCALDASEIQKKCEKCQP